MKPIEVPEEWTMRIRTAKAAYEDAKAKDRDAQAELRSAIAHRKRLVRRLRVVFDRIRQLDPNHPELPVIEAALVEKEAAVKVKPRLKRPRVFAVPPVLPGAVVYFIQATSGGPIKIGTTKNLEERMLSLQGCSPLPLRVIATTPGDSRREVKFHRRLKKHRLHGEWFADVEDVQKLIAEVVA